MELKAATMPWDTVRLRIPFRFSGYSPILRVPKIGLTRSAVSPPLSSLMLPEARINSMKSSWAKIAACLIVGYLSMSRSFAYLGIPQIEPVRGRKCTGDTFSCVVPELPGAAGLGSQ